VLCVLSTIIGVVLTYSCCILLDVVRTIGCIFVCVIDRFTIIVIDVIN
jgi:hypothetical protein